MNFNEWHLAYPVWLWGLLFIPLMWVAYFLFYHVQQSSKQLESFIDSHLLPYLLVNAEKKNFSWVKTLLAWSFVWCCLILALGGPRWNYREIEMASKDQALVILLDLSESMNATDIKPSRLIRAKQKIEDLLKVSKGIKIGLIAFAADPHMISPITDDRETIRHVLPSLDTDLVYVQGSRLSPALKMAAVMLEAEPGQNKALVVMSDGGFEDKSAIGEVKQLADKGVVIHAIGMGTEQGAVLRDHQGNTIKKNGAPILSKLSREPMEEISRMGGGYYIEQNYSHKKDSVILDALQKKGEALEIGKKSKFWDEGFFWFLLPALPIILWWFRKKGQFVAMIILFSCGSFLEGGIKQDYFMNSEALGKEALEKSEYEIAVRTFQDPYRKGVASYQAGDFAEAEKLFKESFRQEVACEAAYNLGNALAKQQKFKEALTAYEEVLEKWPDHQKAKENLEIIKKIIEQQSQESQEKSEKQEKQEEKETDNNSKDQKSDSSQNQQKKEREEEDSNQGDQEKKESDSSEGTDSNESDSDHSKEEDQKHSENSKDQKSQESEDKKQSQETVSEASEEQFQDEKPNDQVSEGDNGLQENREGMKARAQEDLDADIWLNRLSNDPKTFLKNKFYIESKKNGTKEGIDPW